MKVQTPHDKFFKETFGKVEVAKDFLNNYLPENVMNIVDMNTLEPQKDSFIDKDLKEIFADMLFRVNIDDKEGYIYFLFEHKSYTSKNISFQLLKYMIEIWEDRISNKNVNELPMIIPIVIYHGEANWNINSTLGELIKGYKDLPKDVQKYIPDYEYLLYDLSKFTDEEIKGKVINKIVMTTLRDTFTKNNEGIIESLYRTLIHFAELEDQQTGIEYFETLMRYIFSARVDLSKKDVNKILSKIETTYPEGSEVVMTLAERFREEGMEEGMLKGLALGETNSLIKTNVRLLTKKFGTLPEEIKVGISKLDVETLELITVEIFEYESLDDIKKYL